jgi:hypothetical protein
MTNGRFLNGKKTKHIWAKFFFIIDRIDDREMIIVNCPTEGMWADILTKPLQGKAYRVMRSNLMNCDANYFENEEAGCKSTKRKPVIRRVSKHGSTQSLQECVARPATLKSPVVMDSQLRGHFRIVRRRNERPKQKRGE